MTEPYTRWQRWNRACWGIVCVPWMARRIGWRNASHAFHWWVWYGEEQFPW